MLSFIYVYMKKLVPYIITIVIASCVLFLEEVTAKPYVPQKYEGWENVVVPKVCSFQIPPTMELQSPAYTALMQKAVPSAFIGRQAGTIAQQKGLNNNEQAALRTYARIMVDYFDLEERMLKLDKKLSSLPSADLQSILRSYNDSLQESVNDEMKQLRDIGQNGQILYWQPTKILNVNGRECLFTSYIRQTRDNPPAVVLHYIFFNNDRIHMIRVAYREVHHAIWRDDLHKVINTFDFVKR